MKAAAVGMLLAVLGAACLSGCANLLPLVIEPDPCIIQRDLLTLAGVPYPGAIGSPKLSGADPAPGGRLSTIDYDSGASVEEISRVLTDYFLKAGFQKQAGAAPADFEYLRRANVQGPHTRVALSIRAAEGGWRHVHVEMFVPAEADLVPR